MKRSIFAGCLAVMLMLSLATALLPPSAFATPQMGGSEEPAGAAEEGGDRDLQEEAAAGTTAAPQESRPYDSVQKVRVLCGGTVRELTLEAYLTGVVLGEMPASFESAALEAQAVAARTFTLRQQRSPKHDNADVCSDSSCCQQYTEPDRAKEKLGARYAEYTAKVQDAVNSTDGLVITYGGELIDAVYFSCSGGATEAAVAVWGGDVPYLQSVESPGEEGSSRYQETVRMDPEEFRELILQSAPQADLSGEPAGWFGKAAYSDGGGVSVMEIGGVPFRGTALRSLLSLRSTWFTVAVEDGEIVFETRGNGHRVGMSQYGAQAMALEGADFREILTHYYTGVSIVRAEDGA